VIGAGGVERVVEISLDPEEKAAFDKSVAAVRELIGVVKNLRS
jgi:malate dehydrogenase